MENDLAGDEVVVHFDIDAVGVESIFYCYGELFGYGYYMCEGFIRGFVEVGVMSFGDDESVPDIYGVDVEKGEEGFVFVDFGTRDFSGNNFTK